MAAISKEEAQKIIAPYIETILTCVQQGAKKYYSGPEFMGVRHKLSKRSDASNCHDFVISEIMDEFDNIPKTRCYFRRNLFLLTIGGLVVLRFKMFDENNLSHNIMTRQQTLFNAQQVEQLKLPGMPPNGLLYVGYRLNELKTGVDGVFITCRKENRNLWEWDLLDEVTAAPAANIAYGEFKTDSTPKRKVLPKTSNVGEIDEAK